MILMVGRVLRGGCNHLCRAIFCINTFLITCVKCRVIDRPINDSKKSVHESHFAFCSLLYSLNSCVAASILCRTIIAHLSNASLSPSSSASISPGNVAPEYPVHFPGANTVCLNHDLPSRPFAYKNCCSKRRYFLLILRARR